MDHGAPLEQLAAQLYAAAKDITLFCKQQNHPQRSLDRIEPATLLPADAPHAILMAQQNIKEAALRIQQLINDPNDFIDHFQVQVSAKCSQCLCNRLRCCILMLRRQTSLALIAYISRFPQYQQLACLRWLFHFDILSHIPLERSVSYETIASAAHVPLGQLRSIVRMAMTTNLLREPIHGEVAHSSTSAAFVMDPSLRDWALFTMSNVAMIASYTVEATEKYGDTESKTQTAFNVWKNSDQPFFDYVTKDRELTRQFAGFMKNVSTAKCMRIQHLLTGYDWASLGKATVVDVCLRPLACYKNEDTCTENYVSIRVGWWLQWPCQYRTR